MDNNLKDIRDAFFGEIYKIIASDKNAVFIADDIDAFVLQRLKKDFSNQYINIGVAEQNLMNVAAGLATSGKKVFVYGICSYITSRCYEQIKFSICSMKLPVVIIGAGAGFSFPFDGPTHHATIDIGIMRLLPEITILNPIDTNSAKYSAQVAYTSSSPVYVRLDKGKHNNIYKNENEAKRGFKEIFNARKKNVISTGYMSQVLLRLFEENQNLTQEFGLFDIYQIKPLPSKFLKKIEKSKVIITIEENSLSGGLGTIITEYIADNKLKIKLKRIASRDEQFFAYGSREHLLKINKLNRHFLLEYLNEDHKFR